MPDPAPAYTTKHIPLLTYPFAASTFHLIQLDDGISHGTTLWLGAQCLSIFLSTIHHKLKPKSPTPPRAVELGSGIGLTALVLSSLGWDVLATDISHVISTVLSRNIQYNLPLLPPASGDIAVRELDWTISPDHWNWSHSSVIASNLGSSPSSLPVERKQNNLIPPFDLICSADTVYTPSLVQPLLRTFHALCTLSLAASASSRVPPVYLCVERRDPTVIDRVISDATNIWGFNVDRIPRRRLVKAMGKSGINWNRNEWDAIEIWKFTLKQSVI